MAEDLSPAAIIARKRDGGALTAAEIRSFVHGASGRAAWADYQLSALLMAITLRGMSAEETAELTRAVMESGVVADLSRVRRPKVDKHSTGGVGDKVSLILAPMVVAGGAAVPMISGRGLGHTGGTLDKLESIRGFRVNLTLREYAAQVEKVGTALIGQTAELAPADKKLYALRDVTATVESVPLICASIMGKKLAEGIDALVLDVKVGRGAFMPTIERARELAQAMVAIGTAMGKPVCALLTAMEQPLGHAVGNAVEVAESIACLRGEGPADLMEVTYALGEQMLLLAGLAGSAKEARGKLEESIRSGEAFNVFRRVVAAQGGDVRMVDDPASLPAAPVIEDVAAKEAGWVKAVDARAVAMAALSLGAGRIRVSDAVDPAVGFTALAKVGQKVEPGAKLATIHARTREAASRAREAMLAAIEVGPKAPQSAPIVLESIL
ncbi:MAG TPA: thymidine phosphorylase [Opitutaceae bacterium]